MQCVTIHGAVLSMLGAFSVFMKYAHLWHLNRVAAGESTRPAGD